MDTECPDARFNLPKEGPAVYMRKCKAGKECIYQCEHSDPHLISIACNVRCCDVPGKNVRCAPIDQNV